MLTRRKLFACLAVAPVAAPVAVKAMAEKPWPSWYWAPIASKPLITAAYNDDPQFLPKFDQIAEDEARILQVLQRYNWGVNHARDPAGGLNPLEHCPLLCEPLPNPETVAMTQGVEQNSLGEDSTKPPAGKLSAPTSSDTSPYASAA